MFNFYNSKLRIRFSYKLVKVNCLSENSHINEIKNNATLIPVYTGFHSLTLNRKRRFDLLYLKAKVVGI